jgi:hypothetical protein
MTIYNNIRYKNCNDNNTSNTILVTLFLLILVITINPFRHFFVQREHKKAETKTLLLTDECRIPCLIVSPCLHKLDGALLSRDHAPEDVVVRPVEVVQSLVRTERQTITHGCCIVL